MIESLHPHLSFKGFIFAYALLSEDGVCDDIGSAEFVRVAEEWGRAGMPHDVQTFIRVNANRPPQDTAPSC